MLKRKPLLLIGSRVVVFLLNACGSSTPVSVQDSVFANVSALPGSHNPLSCAVTANVGNGVAVLRVAYSAENGAAGTTPDFAVSSSSVTIPVLGLMPETNYTLKLQAVDADGTSVDSDPASCLTGALPSTLPALAVSEQPGAEPGYTMIGILQGLFSGSSSSGGASSGIAGPLIVDHTGQIVWYRDAFEGAVTDWQKQPDGTYTASINQIYVPEGYIDNRYFQLDSLGNVIRTYSALGQWLTDNHELRLLSNGDALLFAIDSRTMDLTQWGGQSSVTVIGNILERISPASELLFSWDALDHLDIGSTDPLILQGLPNADSLDFTHGNAIDVSADGSYLVSLRNLSQVIKVNQSGSIVWRLGGVDSDFRFVNDPLGRFSLQHGMRELPNGNILLFDNGVSHQPPQSRAVEYQLDLNAMTATLVWQYDADPHLFGPFMGFTQRLENGNTLITYGALSVIREVNPAGDVVWELQGAPTDGFYRAIRIPSLY